MIRFQITFTATIFAADSIAATTEARRLAGVLKKSRARRPGGDAGEAFSVVAVESAGPRRSPKMRWRFQ